MKSPVADYLHHVMSQCADNHQGQVADYIPELAQVDPDQLALAVSTIDGRIYSVGNNEVEFSIQSMSKPFAYALALQQQEFEPVLAKVGVEPSGDAFNKLSLDQDNKPKNPMINSGAITTHALIKIHPEHSRAEQLRRFLSELAGRELSFDEDVYQSEIKTAFRNLSIGYMLRSVGALETDPVEIVEGYIRQCAIKVTVKDLAKMCSVLVNGGIQPESGERLLSRDVVRQVLSVMMGCGMYNAAGDWLSKVGIPAKSGVSGGIIGVLPAQVGIAVFSPKLDEYGNSVRGIEMFERLSRDMGLHLMEGSSGQSIMQRRYELSEPEPMIIYELRGALQFAEAEDLLHILAQEPVNDKTVVLDLNDVSLMHRVGCNMLLEGIDRLMADGHAVIILDAEKILAKTHTHQGHALMIYTDLDEYIEKSSPS